MGLGVELVRSRSLLRLMTPQEVVDWASEQVAEGFDDTALVELAALWDDDADQTAVDSLLDRVLLDRGLALPDRQEAVKIELSVIAMDVIEGRLTPAVGVHRAWAITLSAGLDLDAKFIQLTALASEYDDDEENRIAIESEIVAVFRGLLISDPPTGGTTRE